MLIVPCALTTLGAATLAALASAAPFKNLRRVAAADGDLFGITSSLAYKLRDDVLRHLNPPMISRFQSRASSRRHKPPSKKYRSRSYRFKCKTVFALSANLKQEANVRPNTRWAGRPIGRYVKRCALCHGKLGLGARFRNIW